MKVGDEVYLKSNPTMIGRLASKREKYPVFCVLWDNGYEDFYSESELILTSEYVKEVPYKTLEDYENSLAEKFMHEEEPKGHQNAAILMEIAKEAAINTEYWEEFQWYDDQDELWYPCTSEHSLLFAVYEMRRYPKQQVRRKPRTIRIGNYDVPELFVRLYTEVKGLSFGTDWNKGTHAKHHREAILECVKLIGDAHDDAMKEFMVGNK